MTEPTGNTFVIGATDFLLNGSRFQIRCGELHAARVPRDYWRHRLKMARAMGLNTVCAYLFWNQIEASEGDFQWKDQADIAEFCRLAQSEGLWVILRPGPYACAEWDMGGIPWWLLKRNHVQLRSSDPFFLSAVEKYFSEVGRALAPLQISCGGPILMVQVENEYGYYGNDQNYIGSIRAFLLAAGFDVPLFQCNPPEKLVENQGRGLFQAVNFGGSPAEHLDKLRCLQSFGPLFCSEFYAGWFDTWGRPHHRGNTASYLADLEYMLSRGASFSIYMAHGGTTFGLWAGCDRPFKPDTSSYDYDAPISEAGRPTERFFRTRALLSKYLLPGETLPPPVLANSLISFGELQLHETAPLFENLPFPSRDRVPRNMEAYDQGYGCILYRKMIEPGPATFLQAEAVHDFGYVFLDGKWVGALDRRAANARVLLPERQERSQLDILVEPMGRINFGSEISDRKGLIEPVKADGKILYDWEIYNISLDRKMMAGLSFAAGKIDRRVPAFWRGTLHVEDVGDTFLDLRLWGKGIVWINGRCLCRYWNVGPTQTAFLPGCWLRKGHNVIVMLDFIGPEKPAVSGLLTPILDELHVEKDFNLPRRREMNLAGTAPIFDGQFSPGSEAQEIKFPKPSAGRYFCLESLSAWDGKPYAAVADLDLLDATFQSISRSRWTVAYADSEERTSEDGTAENAIDGQRGSFWHTEWSAKSPDHPHQLILDLGDTQLIHGFRYLPRQNPGGGFISKYRVFIGDDLIKL